MVRQMSKLIIFAQLFLSIAHHALILFKPFFRFVLLDNYPKIRAQVLDGNIIIVDFEFANGVRSSDVTVSIREDQASQPIERYVRKSC